MALIKDDEGNYVDSVTGRYPKDANGKDIVSNRLPDPTLDSAIKKPKGQGAKEWFSNIDNVIGLAKGAIGIGTEIADTVKGEKPKTKPKGGGGGGGNEEVVKDDLILGMSKPLFFGLLGGVILIAGTGIYFAVKSGSDSAAPAAK
jgi:hypothetical protein